MAHYYPLVQAYLQQHNQQTQPSAQVPFAAAAHCATLNSERGTIEG